MTVKSISKTTFSLLFWVFIIILIGNLKPGFKGELNQYYLVFDRIFYQFHNMSWYHSMMLKFVSILIIATSVLNSVYKNKNIFGVPSSFTFVFAIFIASLPIGRVYLDGTVVSVESFWFFVYCIFVFYSLLNFLLLLGIEGSGPKNIIAFVKTLPKNYEDKADMIDRYVLFFAKYTMLASLLLSVLFGLLYYMEYLQ